MPILIIPAISVEAVGKFALEALILPLLSYDTDVIKAVAVPEADGASVLSVPAVTNPPVVV